jgi:hypothetical protein
MVRGSWFRDAMAVRHVPRDSETFRGLEALSVPALVRVEPPRKRSHYYQYVWSFR